MSFTPNSAERGCGSGFPQPVSENDRRRARELVRIVNQVNCVRVGGPSLRSIVYRDSTDELDVVRHVFRIDLRHYRDIFRDGFQARPQGDTADEVYYNLVEHVNEGGAPLVGGATPRAFVSTTLSSRLSTRYTNEVGTTMFLYEIYAPGGILAQETLGGGYRFPGQREVAFVGGIHRQYIRAVQFFTITGYNDLGFARVERGDPTHPSVVLNRFFNPQSSPERPLEIQNPAYYYMDAQNTRQPLRICIYTGSQEPQEGLPDDSYIEICSGQHPKEAVFYSRIEEWYTANIYDHESYITSAFRSARKNEVYIFVKNECVLMRYVPRSVYNQEIVKGPELVCEGFPSLADTPFGEYGIDCAFGSHSWNEAYIFSGIFCAIMVDYTPGMRNNRLTRGPMSIVSMFPFLRGTVFESGVDAAFEGSSWNEAYLFRGNQCARINYATPRLVTIRPIAEGFSALRNTEFKDGVDAAFASHLPNEAYLFKGTAYAHIHYGSRTTDDYMVSIGQFLPYWPALQDFLPRQNRGIDHFHVEGVAGGCACNCHEQSPK